MLAKNEGTFRRARGRPSLAQAEALESRLLEVALREFLERGYGGTSMRRIVTAAGISKTTLYSRYSSKEDLFRAIVYRQIEQAAGLSVLDSSKGSLNLEKGLNAYFNRMLGASLQGDLLRVNKLIYSEFHRFPELGTAATARMRTGIQQVANFIEACARFEGIPCKDPNRVAEAMVIMMRGYWLDIILAGRNEPADKRARWIERSIGYFISSRKDW